MNKKRFCYVENNICKIPLGKYGEGICDEDRFEEVKQIAWYFDGSSKKGKYIKAKPKGKTIRLHQFLYPEHEVLDHINGDTLDNRACNLRAVTKSQNAMNRNTSNIGKSKFKGVNKPDNAKTWRATIAQSGKKIHIGCFATEEEAARAYDKKAKEIFGEFARLNFPLGTAKSATTMYFGVDYK